MVGIPENERVIVGGDLNGHVGGRKGGEERWHGGWGYGERNEEGKKIVEFEVAFDLVITNTYFQRKREKLITYRSGENKSQIDYILCIRKNSGEVRNTKVIYGEGIATQHKLTVADSDMKVCKRQRHINQCERESKWWRLKDKHLREKFSEKVLEKVKLAESVQEWWKINSAAIRKTGEKLFGLTSGRRVPKDKEAWWWNEEVQKVVKEKKDAKRKWGMSGSAEDGQAYKSAKKEAKRAVAKAKVESVRGAYE
ncbi:uncharacterized protein LOC124594424 [Schistocerca americana]|uniref:uncharacterized protein LOC124594424 n=1 Tax=Schistocerca americana TaxID=7009 RepID=UPI001F4F1423|nr:uncharacterized protein LOC124594424 [Schistocerca americana]